MNRQREMMPGEMLRLRDEAATSAGLVWNVRVAVVGPYGEEPFVTVSRVDRGKPRFVVSLTDRCEWYGMKMPDREYDLWEVASEVALEVAKAVMQAKRKTDERSQIRVSLGEAITAAEIKRQPPEPSEPPATMNPPDETVSPGSTDSN